MRVIKWDLTDRVILTVSILAIVIGIIVSASAAVSLVVGCTHPLPKPEGVTLVRVDGGFMSCTTFLSAPAPDGGK